jgi:hypothetical protein
VDSATLNLPMTHSATSTTIHAVSVAVFGSLNTVGSNSIDLRTGVQVTEGSGSTFASIASSGTGTASYQTSVSTGDLWSIGNIAFPSGATINGTLRVAVTPSPTPAGHVTGSTFAPTTITTSTTTITASFPVPPPADQVINSTLSTGPGAFGNITVNSGGTLSLTSPGIYTFESLTLNDASNLQINTTSASAYFIYIRGGGTTSPFTFSAITNGFDPTKVRFVCFDSRGANLLAGSSTTPFLGTVVTPNGPLNLQGSTREWRGAFFGASVLIQPSSNIVRHFGFIGWEN